MSMNKGNEERRQALLALADRVEKLGCDIVCPLCGEGDFDVPGYIYSHRSGRNCPVEVAANSCAPANNNADVIAVIRAIAQEAGDE